MKTTKKRIQKKSRPNKTRKRNVKRKSRKVLKTHKRKYRNKKYTGEGGNDETEFGFDNPADQPGDPAHNKQDDETTSCPLKHESVERKGDVCNICIPYLQKIFILRYNELKDYIDQIENSIKNNHANKLIDNDSFKTYTDFIVQLREQCTHIYNEATDVNKTYNLEQWINYINRVGGKKGEIATRLDEQIYGVSIKSIGNVPKHKDRRSLQRRSSNKSFFSLKNKLNL